MSQTHERAPIRPSRSTRVSTVALAVMDAAAKLAIPASMLLLVDGSSVGALAAAATATSAAALRGYISGIAVEAALLDIWTQFMDAARRRPATELVHRDHGSEGSAMLLHAIEAESNHHATVVPRLWSILFSGALVGAAVVVLLGARWLVVGAVVFGAIGVLIRMGQRRVGAAHQRMIDCYGPLSVDLSVALDAALELRSQAAEQFVDQRILRGARTMAGHWRNANTWSTILALLPLGVATLALTGPTQMGIRWVRDAVTLHAPEAGILGVTAAALGVGLAGAVQQWTTHRPARRKLESFLRAGSTSSASNQVEADDASPMFAADQDEPILLRGVEQHYSGNQVSTPARVDLEWAPRTGLAITGVNGGGKSTLLLLLAGLLEPTRGTLSIAGTPLASMRRADRAHIAFLPQSPFVAPDRSVEWHLRLTGYDGPGEAMLDALTKVELLPSLEAHGKRHGLSPLDVRLSELSGGERSRLALARVLLREARLILLDEPEAGLDEAGRSLLRALLRGLARNARVAVVAHDLSVVPDDFVTLRCSRGKSMPSKKPA